MYHNDDKHDKDNDLSRFGVIYVYASLMTKYQLNTW